MSEEQIKQHTTTLNSPKTAQRLWHMVKAMPGRYISWLSMNGRDIYKSLKLSVAMPGGRTMKEYIHCKMQDRMTEIMD